LFTSLGEEVARAAPLVAGDRATPVPATTTKRYEQPESEQSMRVRAVIEVAFDGLVNDLPSNRRWPSQAARDAWLARLDQLPALAHTLIDMLLPAQAA
jgi:hypothetical protein